MFKLCVGLELMDRHRLKTTLSFSYHQLLVWLMLQQLPMRSLVKLTMKKPIQCSTEIDGDKFLILSFAVKKIKKNFFFLKKYLVK